MNDKDARDHQRHQENLRRQKEQFDQHQQKLLQEQRDQMSRPPSGGGGPSGGGASGCFSSTTLISTPNGLKQIDQFNKGDSVYAWDQFKSELKIAKVKVLNSYKNVQIVQINTSNQSIKTTEGHPFMTTSGWVKVNKLKANDFLISKSGSKERIDSIEFTDNYETTYNLYIGDYYTYIADGFVVNSFCKFFRLRSLIARNFDLVKRLIVRNIFELVLQKKPLIIGN